MSNSDFEALLKQFEQALKDCERLYLSSAQLCIEQCPDSLPGTADEFYQLMDDLHKGVLIKIYVDVVRADKRWSREEKQFGAILFDHIWPGEVSADRLRDAATHIFREAATLKWHSLVRPFDQVTLLRDNVGQLETVVMRVANLVAKADGHCTADEAERVGAIQRELEQHLGCVDLEDSTAREKPGALGPQAVQQLQEETDQVRAQCHVKSEAVVEAQTQTLEERLRNALDRLDGLIGLEKVKHEIRTLTNFLNLQKQRAAAGLPQTDLSLHMVFGGNPGTGKTTVARIVGQIYGAMGVLEKGHLVETDRSGLVAEYAGQTGPKTSKKIDEALDGVLFVDEAYSLVADSGDDPYGREAVQTLLKRMEDDRRRLVVILAGYPKEMERLIQSNPGLSSRFNTKLTFEDYTPVELGRIFGLLCDQNHYCLRPEARVRLLRGFQWLYDRRDAHFGNGRLVRNTFEMAIRRLANRLASVTTITEELLTTLEGEDIHFRRVPDELWERDEEENLRFAIGCDGCGEVTEAPSKYLGRRVRCRRCDHRFVADWGKPVEVAEGSGS